MQHCKAKPTDSSLRSKEAEEKETTKKNYFAVGEGEKCTVDPK
jgi:hypothetical protein